jgi:transcriptional regulator with XRE-family HTH domain
MPRPPVKEWSSRRYRESRRFRNAARALGLRVRQLREERGLTLQRAAEMMEMDLTHLQKIEAGKLNLTLVSLLRIADGLDQGVEALFTGGPKSLSRVRRTS